MKTQKRILAEVVDKVNLNLNYQKDHPGKITLERVKEIMNGDRAESHPIDAMVLAELRNRKIIFDK